MKIIDFLKSFRGDALDENFRPWKDHGLDVDEGTEVLMAKFGGQAVSIHKADTSIWALHPDTLEMFNVGDHENGWTIRIGNGRTRAATIEIAMHKGERMARGIHTDYHASITPMKYPASPDDLFKDQEALSSAYQEASVIRQSWLNEYLAGKPEAPKNEDLNHDPAMER